MTIKHNLTDNTTCHIEILTPKQDSEDLDSDLSKFAEKYQTVIDSGHVVCITDNPMGMLSFQATEIIPELGLKVPPEQVVVHLNTFHTREHLDEILTKAVELGIRYFLVVSGDGSERLPRLSPESIGFSGNAVTSVELLRFIRKEYPEQFEIGVAFNPYEPQDHELEKMKRKVDAGAKFIITQPIIGRDDRIDSLDQFGLPVIIDVWMSKKIHLLSSCVGYEIPENTPYDPIENLKLIRKTYPRHGLYLALLGFKTQLPAIRNILKE